MLLLIGIICIVLMFMNRDSHEPFLDDRGNCTFDASAYLAAHPGLRSFQGSSETLARAHYLTMMGTKNESSPCGLSMACTFDPAEYKRLNQLNMSNKQAAHHYRTRGIYENRPVCGGDAEYHDALQYKIVNKKYMPFMK